MVRARRASLTHDSETDPFAEAIKIEEPVHVWNGSLLLGVDDGMDGSRWEEMGVGKDGALPKWDACQSPMKQRVELEVDEKVVNLACEELAG